MRPQPAHTVLAQFPEASAINSGLRVAASDLLFLVLSWCVSWWVGPWLLGMRNNRPWWGHMAHCHGHLCCNTLVSDSHMVGGGYWPTLYQLCPGSDGQAGSQLC